ncbi:hypothetical protein D3C76_1060860 [compost metagenome]
MLVDLVLYARTPEGVAGLDELEAFRSAVVLAGRRVVRVYRAAAAVIALRGHAQAKFPLVQLARQFVGSPHFDQMLGRHCCVNIAGAVRGLVDGVVIGITGEQFQPRQHLAADLGIETLADHFTLVQVATVGCAKARWETRIFDSGAFLLNAIDGEAGIDTLFEPLALKTQLVVLRGGSVQRLVASGYLQKLRLVGFGVADVGGPLWRQVESQAGIGCGHALFLEGAVVGCGIIQHVAKIIEEYFGITVLVGGDPRAQDQLGAIVQRQARHAVVAVLLSGVVVGLVRGSAWVGRLRWVEYVHRGEVEQAPALHGVTLGVRVVAAHQHVVM